jgi:hypothetical protein
MTLSELLLGLGDPEGKTSEDGEDCTDEESDE